MLNTYHDSHGNRWTTPQIERKIVEACKAKLLEQLYEHNYNFCENCKRNDCKPLDCSHEISRKYAKENGCVEVLWDLDNIKIRGRRCHQVVDKLDLKFTG